MLASARLESPDVRPDALLAPSPPLVAYAGDVARLGGRSPIGDHDDAWLALAQAVYRAANVAANVAAPERAAVVRAGAEQVAALVGSAGGGAAGKAGAALALFADRLEGRGGRGRGPLDVTHRSALRGGFEALQAVVAEQEQAGAFLLAFATLAGAREAFAPLLDRRTEAALLAQQGRVARQVGALDTAAELYGRAIQTARACRSLDVEAHALIGAGVLAGMRGNYPEARRLLGQALRCGSVLGESDIRRRAHQGLVATAYAARDVSAALIHGWAAMLLAVDDDATAEALVNLAHVGYLVEEHRAVLGAALRALELTSLARVRLPALTVAAASAARLRESGVLRSLLSDAQRTMARSGQPYENARTLLGLAESCLLAGHPEASVHAERAAAIASQGGFHEVLVRVEALRDEMRAAGSPSREQQLDMGIHKGRGHMSTDAWGVVRSLEEFCTIHLSSAGV